MVYLFVHVIWSVHRREPLLSKPVRRVLFAHLQKEGEEKGIRITAMGGVEDHVHCLLQLIALPEPAAGAANRPDFCCGMDQ